MYLAWLVSAAVSSGSPSAMPPATAPVLVAQAQADDAPAPEKPHKKKKKKADSDLTTDLNGEAGSDKGALITDTDAAPSPKGENEPGSKGNPLQLAEGAEKVIQVPGLASAEAYDELAAEVSVHGDELHVKALSAGRTNVQATLKDGTFKTWVLEVVAAPTKPTATP